VLDSIIENIAPGGRLVRSWPLKGGLSHSMTAVQVDRPDGDLPETWVLRQLSPARMASHPEALVTESRVLDITRAFGLPTPAALLLHKISPGLPASCLVLEYLEGMPATDPLDRIRCAEQFAELLAGIHRIDETVADIGFLPSYSREESTPSGLNDESSDVAKISQALARLEPALKDVNPTVLLHGDFWPGNVLLRDEQLIGVIDWEDAARGEPLVDVGITRLDLLWTFGWQAVAAFTQRYQSLTEFDMHDLKFWDLSAALRSVGHLGSWGQGWDELGRPDVNENTLRHGHQEFVAAVLAGV
jgi:aminoglycoside phosphotransferase (APT) family kinase protein